MADPSLSKHGSQVSEKTVNDASVESGISIAHLPASGDFGGKPMRRAWLKMDLLALPFVTAIYLLYTIDKANVGNARIAGLQEKLHMSDTQFSIALTTTYITQTFMPIASNHFITLFGPRYVLPAMMSLGGFVVAMQGVATNYAGFVACRVFLGLFVGGILAGVNLYLASFYPRRMLQLRISVLWSATSMAIAFSGLLAAAIVRMDGVSNRPGWAWLFIIEGAFTCVFGLACFVLLPNSPTTAWFLTNEERAYVADVLHRDGLIAKAETQRADFWHDVRRTLVQPHAILLTIAAFFVDFTATSLAYFLPSIVVGLGYKGLEAQLRGVPPFAASVGVSITCAIIADKYAVRGATMIGLAIMSTAGFAVFVASSSAEVRYGSLFLAVPGAFGGIVPLSTWIANNAAPLSRTSVALGLIVTITNFSSTLAVWMFGPISRPPRYTSAAITLLVFQVGTLLCAVGTLVYLAVENRRRARLRAEHRRAGREDESEERAGLITNESIWFTYVM